MKLRLLFLLSVIALLSPSLRAEFTFEYEGDTLVYKVIDEKAKTCKVVGHNNRDVLVNAGVVIPEIVSNETTTYTVTEIGNTAFIDCSGLYSISIPNTVTKIGGSAFCRSGLYTIRIPDSVIYIESNAFLDCTNLVSVYIPASVDDIGSGAFANCNSMTKAEFESIESLCNIRFTSAFSNPLSQAHHLYIDGNEITDLIIPKTITHIYTWTFFGCNALTSIDIPNSVNYLSLACCNGLTYINIPNSVTTANIVECTGLTSIDIPNSVKDLNLRDCKSLTSIDIPNSVTYLQLSGCNSLTSIEIPNSLTSIGNSNFSYCTGLTSIRIPNSVTSIGSAAFTGCENLSTVILGHSLNYLGSNTFKDCPITNIFITAPIPPKVDADSFSDYSGTLHLQGEASVEAYGADEVWSKFKRELMVEADDLTIEGENYISGKPGESFQLKANIYPADVTLPYIYWRSTNPKIATVDNNGLVTLLGNNEEDGTRAEDTDGGDNNCKIIAESLYYDGPIAEVTVFNSDFNSVDTVMDNDSGESVDYSKPYEVYGLSGMKVGESTDALAKGIYIVRQGNATIKLSVK